MDALLKELADASMAVGAGEEALEEGANTSARWPELGPAERTVVGKTAAPLRARLDAAQARLPKATALTEVAGEVDPEDEEEPEE
jgi:hypothetical protein